MACKSRAYMRSVLFIHGYSQSFLSWIGQLGARRLGGPLRLLAMDLRGHGLSDKPPGVYTDSGLWADDVQAVISTVRVARLAHVQAHPAAAGDHVIGHERHLVPTRLPAMM